MNPNFLFLPILLLLNFTVLGLQLQNFNKILSLLGPKNQYDKIRFGIDSEHYQIIEVDIFGNKISIYDDRFICSDANHEDCFVVVDQTSPDLANNQLCEYFQKWSHKRIFFRTKINQESLLLEMTYDMCHMEPTKAEVHYISEFKKEHVIYFRDRDSDGVESFPSVNLNPSEYQKFASDSISVYRGYIPIGIDVGIYQILSDMDSVVTPDRARQKLRAKSVKVGERYPVVSIYMKYSFVQPNEPHYLYKNNENTILDMKHCIMLHENISESIAFDDEYYSCESGRASYKYDPEIESPYGYSVNYRSYRDILVDHNQKPLENLLILRDGLPIYFLDFKSCTLQIYDSSLKRQKIKNDNVVRLHEGFRFAALQDGVVLQANGKYSIEELAACRKTSKNQRNRQKSVLENLIDSNGVSYEFDAAGLVSPKKKVAFDTEINGMNFKMRLGPSPSSPGKFEMLLLYNENMLHKGVLEPIDKTLGREDGLPKEVRIQIIKERTMLKVKLHDIEIISFYESGDRQLLRLSQQKGTEVQGQYSLNTQDIPHPHVPTVERRD